MASKVSYIVATIYFYSGNLVGTMRLTFDLLYMYQTVLFQWPPNERYKRWSFFVFCCTFTCFPLVFLIFLGNFGVRISFRYEWSKFILFNSALIYRSIFCRNFDPLSYSKGVDFIFLEGSTIMICCAIATFLYHLMESSTISFEKSCWFLSICPFRPGTTVIINICFLLAFLQYFSKHHTWKPVLCLWLFVTYINKYLVVGLTCQWHL